MLHILTQPPLCFDINLFMVIATPLDDILMIQDSVVLSINNNVYLRKILSCSVNLYVLYSDICKRGLMHQLSKYFISIDYVGFVNLTIKHSKQITW